MWTMRLHCQLLFLCVLLIYGASCHTFFSMPTEKCPEDDVTFTCVVTDTDGIGSTAWNVTTPNGESSTCNVRHNLPTTETCGLNGEFSSSLAEENGDNYTSTLSTSDDFNGTTVVCLDQFLSPVGSESICIVGPVMDPPQFLSAIISEQNVTVNECVVTLEWNEPFISCNGSVSQYVLTVTPPTSDCQSGSGDCVLMTDQTQYDLTVTVDQMYSLTVRADTCRNMQIGGSSSVLSLELGAIPRTSEPFSYHYVFDIITRDIEAINVSWPRVDILNGEAETTYRIVIIPGSGSGSGNEMFFDIVTADTCTDDSCSYTFSSDNITNSYSVAVEVVGCVTERINCTNMSSLCDPEDLRVALPSNDGWSDGQGVFTFSGGRVTFNGISYRSVATYTTTGDYRVNGEQSFQTVCLNDTWIPPANITIARCNASDLLGGVLESDVPTDGTCSEPCSDGLCVRFCNTSVMTTAEYSPLPDYCIGGNGPLLRQCMDDQLWSGQTPLAVEVCDSKLKVWNIVVLVIGAVAFISGVVIAVVLETLLCLRVKNSTATTKLWYKIMLIVSAVVTAISLILWLVLIGYIASNDFCEDGGQLRGANSQCEPPSGDSKVKDALVIASFVFSLLVLIEWSVSAALWTYGVDTNKNKAPQKPQRSKKSKEADQELAAYDNLNHGNPPSSPQPLLSDSDPAYGKLNPDEEQQYSHIQREPKKPVYDPDDPNYSHFPKKEDQHYGKLDHGVKKQSTLPTSVVPPPSDSEYGKLDRSEMDSTPHYGKLDHGVRKGTTLPGTVIPPTGDEYGKLDRTQMEIVSAEPGGMYDVVTNEPRRKPPKALPKAPLGEGLYDPTAKPRKKPGH